MIKNDNEIIKNRAEKQPQGCMWSSEGGVGRKELELVKCRPGNLRDLEERESLFTGLASVSALGTRNRRFEKDSHSPSGTCDLCEFINFLMIRTIIFLTLTVKCLKVFPAGRGHSFECCVITWWRAEKQSANWEHSLECIQKTLYKQIQGRNWYGKYAYIENLRMIQIFPSATWQLTYFKPCLLMSHLNNRNKCGATVVSDCTFCKETFCLMKEW